MKYLKIKNTHHFNMQPGEDVSWCLFQLIGNCEIDGIQLSSIPEKETIILHHNQIKCDVRVISNEINKIIDSGKIGKF